MRSGCPRAGGSPLALVSDRAFRSITSKSSAALAWSPRSRSGATARPRATRSPSASRVAGGTCYAPGATGRRCRSSTCTRSVRPARSTCAWGGSRCAHGRMPSSSRAGSTVWMRRRELTKRGTRLMSETTYYGSSRRHGRCTPSRRAPRSRRRSRTIPLHQRHTIHVLPSKPVGLRFVAKWTVDPTHRPERAPSGWARREGNMVTALATQSRDSGPQRRELDTALTTAAGLSRGDYAGWRLLASHPPLSGPFVDPHWMLAGTEAFAPQEPVLVCARDGRRLVGLAALQRLVESWGGRRLTILQSRTNAESFRFAFLSWKGRVDIQEQLWRALCQSGDCDVIRIEHVPEGSPTLMAALTVAGELGWRALIQPTFLTPWRPLSPTTPWDHGLTRRFKRNLRRAERRLGELGQVRFDVVTTGGALKQALDVFYRLQARGGEGRRRTAAGPTSPVEPVYEGPA